VVADDRRPWFGAIGRPSFQSGSQEPGASPRVLESDLRPWADDADLRTAIVGLRAEGETVVSAPGHEHEVNELIATACQCRGALGT
jgi:hypothetical protein